MWINSPSIRQGAEEKRSGISPKPVPSTFKMISPDSPVRNSICKNIRTSTFYESDCKESGVSNKENKQFESKKAFRRTPICEASRAKHISIGSTYSNCSNYSDDFEEYIDNDEDCINDHQNRK